MHRVSLFPPTSARFLNVIDVEATCWDGPPPPGMRGEIIEIGVAVIDLQLGERIGRRSLLVRPAHSEVSAFCTALTSLTADDLQGGLTLAEACTALMAEFGSLERPWASWGDYDRNQFRRETGEGAAALYPFSDEHHNLKRLFADHLGLKKPPGMAAALERQGLSLEGTHHRGGDDAWNIAGIVLSLRGPDVA